MAEFSMDPHAATSAGSARTPHEDGRGDRAAAVCWTTAVFALGWASALGNGDVGIAWLVAAAVFALLGLVRPRPLTRLLGRDARLPVACAALVAFAQLAVLARKFPVLSPDPGYTLRPFQIGVAALGLLAVVALAAGRVAGIARVFRVAAVLTLAAALGIGIWAIRSRRSPPVDVHLWSRLAIEATMSGQSPYALQMPLTYPEHAPLYGPGWTRSRTNPDGTTTPVVNTGYPYPPLLLLVSATGQEAFGDYRYSMLACFLLVGVVVAAATTSSPTLGLLLMVVLFSWPRWPWTLELGWTDFAVAASFAVVVWAAARRPRWLVFAMAVVIAIKQHGFLVAVPFSALLFPRPLNWRRWLGLVGAAAALAALISLPVALWDLPAIWHSAVLFHLVSPFRPDSLSVSALVYRLWGVQLGSAVGFAALGLVALIAWRRAPPGPAGFAGAAACGYLVFFALNKQAFMNYYVFVAAALVLAVASLPLDAGAGRVAAVAAEGPQPRERLS
jgi:hypothetical protein